MLRIRIRYFIEICINNFNQKFVPLIFNALVKSRHYRGAGIHEVCNCLKIRDSHFYGNDKQRQISTFYKTIIFMYQK